MLRRDRARRFPKVQYRCLAALLCSALLFEGCAAIAAEPEARSVLRTIVIGGNGEARGRPDQARLTAGVVTQGATAATALDANSAAMAKVFAALKQLGIPDDKIQTSNFSLNPRYEQVRPNEPQPRGPAIIGYDVTNQISVVLSDPTKTGATLDLLVRNGANQSYGLSFEFADPKPLIERARIAAVQDAMAKAKTLADTAGIRLGPVLSMQEGVEYRPVETIRTFAATADLQRASTPISAGENSVSVTVTMTYGIQ